MTDNTATALPALLPCPFCGAAPTEHAIEPHSHAMTVGGLRMPDHHGSHVIECGCGAGLIDDTRAAVVARWNTRAASAVRASAGAVEVQQWLPISAGDLPDFDVPVWLYEEGDAYIGCRVDDSDGWLWAKCYMLPYIDGSTGAWKIVDAEVDDDYKPSHWQPLPAAPSALTARPAVALTVAQRIAELIAEHGTLRAVARALQMDVGYLSRLEHGEKDNPSAATLEKLGLRQVVLYERAHGIPSAPSAQQQAGGE